MSSSVQADLAPEVLELLAELGRRNPVFIEKPYFTRVFRNMCAFFTLASPSWATHLRTSVSCTEEAVPAMFDSLCADAGISDGLRECLVAVRYVTQQLPTCVLVQDWSEERRMSLYSAAWSVVCKLVSAFFESWEARKDSASGRQKRHSRSSARC